MKRALLSVTDKGGLVEFARGLHNLNYTLLSTGGTGKKLAENKIPFIPIEVFTGFPECMGGRLKTLHPKIEGGILMDRGNADHVREAVQNGIHPIDLVCCNLYDFNAAAANPDLSFDEIMEQVDIGGPTMIRAAAKNWQWVTVVCQTIDYSAVLKALKRNKAEELLAQRRRLMATAFEKTAAYDCDIADFLYSDDLRAQAQAMV